MPESNVALCVCLFQFLLLASLGRAIIVVVVVVAVVYICPFISCVSSLHHCTIAKICSLAVPASIIHACANSARRGRWRPLIPANSIIYGPQSWFTVCVYHFPSDWSVFNVQCSMSSYARIASTLVSKQRRAITKSNQGHHHQNTPTIGSEHKTSSSFALQQDTFAHVFPDEQRLYVYIGHKIARHEDRRRCC